MKRFIIAVMFATSLVASSQPLFAAGNVSKAKDFMKAGMYPQAIALLEKEVNSNPTNAEAHYELGTCYAFQGQLPLAEQRFKSAVQLKPDYGHKIGTIFKVAGKQALDNGLTNEANSLFVKMLEYQPKLRGDLAKELYADGEKLVNQKIYGPENGYFTVAVALNNALRENVCQIYNKLGDEAANDNCISYYIKSKTFCDLTNERARNRLMDITRNILKTPGQEEEGRIYKEKLSQYVDKDYIERELPDVKAYGPGTYYFKLKAGQQTDHLIVFTIGQNKYDISSADDKFQLAYSDGEVVPAWTAGAFPNKSNTRFKIIAVTDQEIKMVVERKN